MKASILCLLLGTATADLRQASQPKRGFKLLQQGGGRNSQNFVVGTGQKLDGTVDTAAKGKVLYMEPSTFGYGGLANQRAKNYDNFLRSNIDNEQDNRNFNNEVGMDHLPFRTYESAVDTTYPHTGTKAGGDDDSLKVNNLTPLKTVVRTAPGQARLSPLRWNNPHAAELEVNLWIMCSTPPTIVPVKRPTCSGEGNQNNIIEWAIPSDFNTVNWAACPSTKCFTGCKAEGDCVLQVYAHSVETRQYSTSVPIIVEGAAVTVANGGLPSAAAPKDANEAGSYAWPTSYDLLSMVKGTKFTAPGATPNGQTGGTSTGSLAAVKICASSEREAISPTGAAVAQVELKPTEAVTLNAGTIHLYLCKQTAEQIAGEKLVDKVVFTVTGGTQTGAATKTENYTPFEMSSSADPDQGFSNDGVKTITAVITAYGGATTTLQVQLDLTGNPKRWRFRRHLQAACPTVGLPEPVADPWMDLSKLKRETCLSAQDPAANYATTTLQRAVLHSDVANHAYQNSNYSPYSGQQHGEISRNLQAAAVIHMTASNRGELGKNNIPNEVKNTAKQLNKAVNKLYKAYEKVANKVIDAVTNAGGKNGGDVTMGVQKLGSSFRAAEKGATSTKRLKTTTYVPSFNTQGYNAAVIAKVLDQRGGRNGVYKDLLSAAKPNTGATFIQIYQSTMNKMLPDFAAAAAKGVTYMESVKMVPCSMLSPADAAAATKTANGALTCTACCKGSMQNREPGGCGATLTDVKDFKKRNAAGNKDGGQYAGQKFNEQRYCALYKCPAACLNMATKTAILAPSTTKTSKGTCINYLAGPQGCVATNVAGATDCTSCVGIFNNVAPDGLGLGVPINGSPAPPKADLAELVKIVRDAGSDEEVSNVLNSDGDDLAVDDTAVCFTPSSFTCPGENFVADVAAGKCVEEESAKIDRMCDDGPCDNDPDSATCNTAKLSCEVDPDSGVKCMPGSENDPCQDCVKIVGGGGTASVSIAVLVVLASALV